MKTTNESAKGVGEALGFRQCVTQVRLNELVVLPELYCHRPEEDRMPKNLGRLLDDLKAAGCVQVPIEFFTNAAGKKIVVDGHLRYVACKELAEQKVAGFSDSMVLNAIEVLGASEQELLVRSVSNNAIREPLKPLCRIRAAKLLRQASVPDARAAVALGVSEQSLRRDLLIAQYHWMYEHVQQDNVGATHAYYLLYHAKQAGRLKELEAELGAWIEEQAAQIKERDRQLTARGGNGLREAEHQVKRRLSGELVAHWVALIKKKKSLEPIAPWNFTALIDSEKNVLQIGSCNLDITKAPVRRLTDIGAKLSALLHELGPLTKLRYEEEKKRAATLVGPPRPPRDLDFLKRHGLGDIANEYEAEEKRAQAATTDADAGESARRSRPRARPETDLAAEIDDPDAPPTNPEDMPAPGDPDGEREEDWDGEASIPDTEEDVAGDDEPHGDGEVSDER